MINNATIEQILAQYAILRNYCDTLWNSKFKAYYSRIQCRKGCSHCCILQSVNILEAYIIFKNSDNVLQDIQSGHCSTGRCVYLSPSGDCTIYPFRPILCRTHGLLLKSAEFIDNIARSCEFNFTGDVSDASAAAIDIDSITYNAEKLCCAFALAAGDLHLSSARVSLGDIRLKVLPDQLKELFHQ
ncbi:MAG TPA: YkgJ family cysteine cluster protein [Chitinispirillaceae bacterium]|nr:YkgJ family cysteine cluster protein [Chitinispirillaceae bacterium]